MCHWSFSLSLDLLPHGQRSFSCPEVAPEQLPRGRCGGRDEMLLENFARQKLLALFGGGLSLKQPNVDLIQKNQCDMWNIDILQNNWNEFWWVPVHMSSYFEASWQGHSSILALNYDISFGQTRVISDGLQICGPVKDISKGPFSVCVRHPPTKPLFGRKREEWTAPAPSKRSQWTSTCRPSIKHQAPSTMYQAPITRHDKWTPAPSKRSPWISTCRPY